MLWTIVFICLICSPTGRNEQEMHNVKPRIIGGYRINIRSRPFMVSLHDELNDFQCGANILSRRWVITALHCFNSIDQNYYYIRAGSNYTDHGGTLHRVTPPFRFSSMIQPIGLPNNNKIPRRLYVSGWGHSSLNSNSHRILMTVNIPYVPFKACVNSVPLYKLLVRRDRHLCYGRRGKDSCYGDSGGPLADVRTIYGIVSFGHNCGEVSGVYAKIFYYREWIKIITKL
uniref:trypsin-3-like isoform X1 n=1 Tax=Vespula vulgaris TaxID=7454 RepID=UPI00223B79A3|nr:trypsin-3-like isoform X1 [Vespula vulgaris]